MARGSIRKKDDRPNRPWEARVELPPDPATGKRRSRSRSFRTRREAERALAAWIAEIDAGTAVDRSRESVADTLRAWLEAVRPNLRPKTIQLYGDAIERRLVPAIGRVPVQALTPATLQRAYTTMLTDGVSAWGVHDAHAVLSRALRHAMRLGLVARNVCEAVTPPKVTHREMAVWDQGQARRFLAAAGREGASAYGPVWLLALTAGLRRGELLGLRWRDIDLDAGVAHIRRSIGSVGSGLVAGAPKSATSARTVALAPPVVAALREHRARQNERRLLLGAAWHDHDLVFPSGVGTPIQPSNLRRDFLRLAERAGIPPIRIHDQRHTYATLALGDGASAHTVAEAMGHADPAVTLRTYAHVLQEHRRALAERTNRLFFGPDSDAAESPEKPQKTSLNGPPTVARGTDAGQVDGGESAPSTKSSDDVEKASS